MALIWLDWPPTAGRHDFRTVRDPSAQSSSRLASRSPVATWRSRYLSPLMNPASLLRPIGCGKYSIRVAKEGFDDLVTTVDLQGTAISA